MSLRSARRSIACEVALGVLEPRAVFLELSLRLRRAAPDGRGSISASTSPCPDVLPFGEQDAHELAVQTAAHGHGLERRHRAERADLHVDGVLLDRDDADGNGLVGAAAKSAALRLRLGARRMRGPE